MLAENVAAKVWELVTIAGVVGVEGEVFGVRVGGGVVIETFGFLVEEGLLDECFETAFGDHDG